MSGTSVDGLDICCAEFTGDVASDVWSRRMLTGVTYPYTDAWTERLRTAPTLCGEDLVRLHFDYAHLVGRSVRRFIDESRLDGVNVVASHGHTVFHQPHRQLTFQLGDGETIASYVRSVVVSVIQYEMKSGTLFFFILLPRKKRFVGSVYSSLITHADGRFLAAFMCLYLVRLFVFPGDIS